MKRLIKLALLIIVVLVVLVATNKITINDEVKEKINTSIDNCYVLVKEIFK